MKVINEAKKSSIKGNRLMQIVLTNQLVRNWINQESQIKEEL